MILINYLWNTAIKRLNLKKNIYFKFDKINNKSIYNL